MPLDLDILKNYGKIETHQDWTAKDSILYALGIGADELEFVYEQGLQALPMMLCVLAYPGFIWQRPELGIDWKRIVHVEQEIVCHGPIPVGGAVSGTTSIDAVVDKGLEKGAIIYSSRRICDAEGRHFATTRAATMARGDGGFSTPDKPMDTAPWPIIAEPAGAADEVYSLATSPGQAMLYRLSGDLNPLHIDPAIAAVAGFERPILHGMCTFGVAGRALLKVLCGNRPELLRSMRCRFSAPVYPGETIRTEVWRTAPDTAIFRCVAEERNIVVLKGGHFTFHSEVI